MAIAQETERPQRDYAVPKSIETLFSTEEERCSEHGS